jgi:hypothetical protein
VRRVTQDGNCSRPVPEVVASVGLSTSGSVEDRRGKRTHLVSDGTMVGNSNTDVVLATSGLGKCFKGYWAKPQGGSPRSADQSQRFLKLADVHGRACAAALPST